jgi:N-acetyl sugar amidotransferase
MVNVCSRCLYDDNKPNIFFDADGVCNYCHIHDETEHQFPIGEEGKAKLKVLADKIRRDGKGKEYDCVIGVSGGCDSSFLMQYAVKELNLRPLAVHFDNTWNSRIAVENIHRVLGKLNLDLYTYVMDNDEFNDLARSFLYASVPEIDALTDIALLTTLYMACDKHKVKYILEGHSFRTEGITPQGWFYFDGKYIDSIHKQFGRMDMNRFPNLWLRRWMKYLLKGITRHRPLYYVDYHKDAAKQLLKRDFDWQWYGGHHMENRYTLFNNNYILPKKFGIDLRLVEFSALVRSGQMTKEEAMRELQTPLVCEDEVVNEVKKRLDLSDEEFERIMALPIKSHKDYETYQKTFKRMRPFFYLMMRADRVTTSFYLKYCK